MKEVNYTEFLKTFECGLIEVAFNKCFGLSDMFANCKQESDKKRAINELTTQTALRKSYVEDNWGFICLFAEARKN
jgi:hypothetical protein